MTSPEQLRQQAFQEALIRRAEQEKEYGKYVATQVIYGGSAPAFNVGDPVPIGHVERFGWLEEGKVALREDFFKSQPAPALPSKESIYAALGEENPNVVKSQESASSKPKTK